VTPIAPAANAFRLDNLVEDIGNLVSAVAQFAGTGNVAIVAAPAQWASLRLRTPTLGYPVWSSVALPAGTVSAIALPTFVCANGDVPTFDLSMTTALTTTDPGSELVTSGGVVGAPTQSTFQADLVALKLNLPVSGACAPPASRGCRAQIGNVVVVTNMTKALQTTKARSGELVTMEGDLPTVVGALAANVQRALANMTPDDVLIELDAYQEGTRSSARLRFRAYRRAAG
jgi:hypothetical protein